MSFIVATNIIASQPPERRTTGTPTTHANCFITIQLKFSRIHMWSLTMPHMADSVLFVPDCPTLSSSNMCQLMIILIISCTTHTLSVLLCPTMESDNNPLIPTWAEKSPGKLSERSLDFVSKWRKQILLGFGLFVFGVFLFVVLAILLDSGLYEHCTL